MREPADLVHFPYARDAYAFVSELRRLGRFDRLCELRVVEAGDGAFVEMPKGARPYGGLASVAERYGGHVATTSQEREQLQAAIDAARAHGMTTRERVGAAATAAVRRNGAMGGDVRAAK